MIDDYDNDCVDEFKSDDFCVADDNNNCWRDGNYVYDDYSDDNDNVHEDNKVIMMIMVRKIK